MLGSRTPTDGYAVSAGGPDRERDEHRLEEQPHEALGVGVEAEAVAALDVLLDVAREDRDEERGEDDADPAPLLRETR